MSDTTKSWTEELKVSGENLLQEIERLIHEGNVSHVVIKNDAGGHTIAEFPINIALIGIIVAPVLAAVAAIAVYASHFTVVVTRIEPVEPPPVVETIEGQ